MTNMDESYNGWTNWDTWNMNLWLANDYDSYHYTLRCIRSLDDIAEAAEAIAAAARMWWTVLPDAIDDSRVNWTEIAESFLEE